MIQSVVPSLASEFRITIVLLEESDRLAVAHTYHDLTFLTIFTRRTVGTHQIDVVLGVGDTHRTWLRLHPGEGTEGHGGLRLSEALHHLDTCLLVELIEDGGVQSLTCRTAVFE